jgi:transglutaminase-like putative cysteine protease
MKLLTVRHATLYRYSAPVTFGQHRLMLRPRDSHDLRLVGAEQTLSPPGRVRWTGCTTCFPIRSRWSISMRRPPSFAAVQGAGATHAWAEIYLPGAGWVEFDPTNGLIAGENLIRVAVTRDPAQAVPIGGSFAGEADYLGMDVEVTVHAEG